MSTKRVLMAALWIALSGCGAAQTPMTATDAVEKVENATAPEDGVPKNQPVHSQIQVFALAHCPHAAQMIRTLVGLKSEFGSAIELTIDYMGGIGEDGLIDKSNSKAEIESAKALVCIEANSDDAKWLDYTRCLYEDELWRAMPTSWPLCAGKVGIDQGLIEQCIKSGRGEDLLTTDYESATEREVMASPTILIDGRPYFGGRSAEALSRHLCFVTEGQSETRPAVCNTIEPPPEVAATLMFDSRCDDANKCDVSYEVVLLNMLVPGLKLVPIDYMTEEGQQLFDLIQKAADVTELPLIVLDGAIASEKAVFERMGEYLVPFGDGYLLRMGNGWNPTAEICDNGIDDTGNSAVDCADPTCKRNLICREAQPGRLDLFIMSECPFAHELIPAVVDVLNHFGKKRSQLDLHFQFIGDTTDDGEITSMHGPTEVQEDLRMICAQALYGRDYRFMEYIDCRMADLASADEAKTGDYNRCIPSWMNKKRLERCATGKQGQRLLKESMALADSLGITGSPSWLLNDRFAVEARNAKELVAVFCEHNDDRLACEKEIVIESKPDSERSAQKCE